MLSRGAPIRAAFLRRLRKPWLSFGPLRSHPCYNLLSPSRLSDPKNHSDRSETIAEVQSSAALPS